MRSLQRFSEGLVNRSLCGVVCVIGLGLLVGCSDNETIDSAPAPTGAVEEIASQPVLATVGDSTITEADLEMLLQRVGGDSAMIHSAEFLSSEVNRDKLLESLINSRAMAKAAEKDLTPGELADLDRQARFYREELLVKRYLNQHAAAQPVSMEMVKDYYQQHQQEFEDEPQFSFEVLTSYGELTETQRKTILSAFELAKSEPDWKMLEQQLFSQGLPVRTQQARARTSLLTERLRALIEATPVGSVSAISVADNVQIVRVKERIPGAINPLAEVSSEIRKRLAPMMMKEAIAEVAAHAKAQVDVKYAADQ